MDDGHRIARRPLEVRREFVGCRLEAQVLIRAYDLAVPVIRRQVNAARTPQGNGVVTGNLNRTGRIAQGA